MNNDSRMRSIAHESYFLDRDGLSLWNPDEQLDSLEKLELFPGGNSGTASSTGRGYKLVIVSNQDNLGSSAYPN